MQTWLLNSSAGKAFVAACFVLSLSTSDKVAAATQDIVNCDGYPCVNFAFGANISRSGALFGSTFYNPPQLGAGLEPLGGGQLILSINGNESDLSQLSDMSVERLWPFARIVAQDPRFPGIVVKVTAFSPIGIDDSFTSTLPVAMASIQIENTSDRPSQITLRFEPAGFLKDNPQPLEATSISGKMAENSFIAWVRPDGDLDAHSGPSDSVTADLAISFDVQPDTTEEQRLMIGHWEENYPSSAKLTNISELAAYIARYWDVLLASTERLEHQLPKSGSAEIDEYLRWYMTAGVAMSRVLKDGTALTLGYHELNQRDSFWTSWAHLVLWPQLERRMIEESAWGQRRDGKVPTTILPLIEREEDVDINCYFILRALRYTEFHNDEEFGRKLLPSLILAADWLASRDIENKGLPRQTSFWNDWKDVPGMEGRSYSPYASMLYVAAMQQLGDYCEQLGEEKSAQKFHELANRGEQMLNASLSEGGLFNGQYYEHLWDTKPDNLQHVSEDQVVGVLFDAIPESAQDSLLDALQKSITQWGARETFPFFSGDFGYDGGDYHNGGIWPYMNHIHAWALLKRGRKQEGFDLLKKVGKADLVMAQDYVPHEYLNGKTGKQAGVPMQGWNAAMFGTIYFGNLKEKSLP